MTSHLRFLTVLHLLRALGGLALSGLFLYYSQPSNIPANPFDETISRFHALEEGDTTAFLVIGLVTGGIAVVRGVHAFYTFLALGASRRELHWRRGLFAPALLGKSRLLGLGLAALDLIDLTFFPVTTACGLYGMLVYGHVDTVDFFEAKFLSAESVPAS